MQAAALRYDATIHGSRVSTTVKQFTAQQRAKNIAESRYISIMFHPLCKTSRIQGDKLVASMTPSSSPHPSPRTSNTVFVRLYRISPNKRARRRGTKRTLNLVSFGWNLLSDPLGTWTLSAENLLGIGSVFFEISQVKIKSRGVRLFKQARSFRKIRYAHECPNRRTPLFLKRLHALNLEYSMLFLHFLTR